MKQRITMRLHYMTTGRQSAFWNAVQRLCFRFGWAWKYYVRIDGNGVLWSCSTPDQKITALAFQAKHPGCQIGDRVSWGRRVYVGGAR